MCVCVCVYIYTHTLSLKPSWGREEDREEEEEEAEEANVPRRSSLFASDPAVNRYRRRARARVDNSSFTLDVVYSALCMFSPLNPSSLPLPPSPAQTLVQLVFASHVHRVRFDRCDFLFLKGYHIDACCPHHHQRCSEFSHLLYFAGLSLLFRFALPPLSHPVCAPCTHPK